jgi:hypothetical protein
LNAVEWKNQKKGEKVEPLAFLPKSRPMIRGICLFKNFSPKNLWKPPPESELFTLEKSRWWLAVGF